MFLLLLLCMFSFQNTLWWVLSPHSGTEDTYSLIHTVSTLPGDTSITWAQEQLSNHDKQTPRAAKGGFTTIWKHGVCPVHIQDKAPRCVGMDVERGTMLVHLLFSLRFQGRKLEVIIIHVSPRREKAWQRMESQCQGKWTALADIVWANRPSRTWS